ncbi:uncharacterized protein LOC108918206 isoform X2 [Scleropages formosus]|uniref:uncharacterized protein LOC108918206 isoform X2 n=1 Tax=Scleropages formosus TaxID=113540 RepID=UPI0008791C4E|nr:uncharacterized protein LOC108918206 isoform X2 [Scleropages formosus]
MIFQLIFPACLILAATSSASFITAPPDGLTSKAENVTSAVPVFTASNITIAPNYTWNSPTSTKNTPSVAATIYENSTKDSPALSTSTLQPENTITSTNTQLTTTLQPSANATAGPTGIVPVSTHGTLPSANTDKASNAPPHGYQTTEPNPYKNISAWTFSSAHPITEGVPSGMSYSEKSMTIFFSVLLGIVVLVILMYIIKRCKRKTQYSHRPLCNSSEETVDRFVAADDTLVISGGLYDGPCIYNPTINTLNEEEEFHNDQPPFAPRPTHFRLEFLNEDQESKSLDYKTSKLETFQPVEKDS